MTKKIGIIGPKESPEVSLLAKQVEELSAEPVIVDFAHFPYSRCISVGSKGSHSAVIDNIDLFDISAFYIRQPGWMWPMPQQKLSKEEWKQYYDNFVNYMADERESLSLKYSLLNILAKNCLVVNSYKSIYFHSVKPLQFGLFKKMGLPVPEFLCTNDFEQLKSFINKYDGDVVIKNMSGGEQVFKADILELEKNIGSLLRQPRMLQKFIRGKNIRAFVLGRELICAAHIIHGEQIDSRAEPKDIKIIDVPDEVKRICIDAASCLGMIFSGVDLQYSEEENKYYLLECNPSPMFANYESYTKTDVSKKLAEYLIKNGK